MFIVSGYDLIWLKAQHASFVMLPLLVW